MAMQGPGAAAEARDSDRTPANAYTLSIANGRAHAPDVIRVRQGERVSLSIASDRAGTLEIHGYGQQLKLEPDAPAVLAFVAAKTGRFGVDLHELGGRHVEVTALEVQPK
jgi:FtsP/CotA-like multicopper oxidase with cupredoxin domain